MGKKARVLLVCLTRRIGLVNISVISTKRFMPYDASPWNGGTKRSSHIILPMLNKQEREASHMVRSM
jgi:hypothetical protein